MNKIFGSISKEVCGEFINEFKKLIYLHIFNIKCDEKKVLKTLKKILKTQLKYAYTLSNIMLDTNFIIYSFLNNINNIIEYLKCDLEAFYNGDPASYDRMEIVLCYASYDAIIIYRLANFLYSLDIPYIPRYLSEYAHSLTGIDIHPGCTIGKGFFIDHGTGVVIGQTTKIGENVTIYHNVTLGASSLKGGRILIDQKRHPTIGDNVIIYANSSILGKDSIIYDNEVISINTLMINGKI